METKNKIDLCDLQIQKIYTGLLKGPPLETRSRFRAAFWVHVESADFDYGGGPLRLVERFFGMGLNRVWCDLGARNTNTLFFDPRTIMFIGDQSMTVPPWSCSVGLATEPLRDDRCQPQGCV